MTENKIEKKDIEKIVLVNVPNQIYSELRKIFISLFENSGFKDVKINENIDFQKLNETEKINKNSFLILFIKSLCIFTSDSDISTTFLL